MDPTEDGISFLQKLVATGGKLTLQGNMSLLKIERLIPEYVLLLPASKDTGVFTLTEEGGKVAHRFPRQGYLMGVFRLGARQLLPAPVGAIVAAFNMASAVAVPAVAIIRRADEVAAAAPAPAAPAHINQRRAGRGFHYGGAR